ncbi:MAG: hypothetical protein KatS3mg068_0762 [Candidatus Sericytochromatia bacterium]|nr:MAG: hypothetical protein KatS3mg068_0762 [Candidatus Sericytochromatia bacterium]
MKKIILSLTMLIIITNNSNAELIDISQNDNVNIQKYIPTISSTFIPGSGQIINQDYLKGILFFTSLVTLISIDIFLLKSNNKK